MPEGSTMNTEAKRQAAHAMRQAGRAAKQGDVVAAERWSKTAERLSAAAAHTGAASAEEVEAARLKQAEAEDLICHLFEKAAFIANAMVHAPMQAPAAFQGLVKLWREQNLGEGEADAEKAAAKQAAAQAAWLDGRFEETLPDYVRARMDEAWAARREELAAKPPIPVFWASD
jgi:hypothetical protein